jgi:hypothetical protein
MIYSELPTIRLEPHSLSRITSGQKIAEPAGERVARLLELPTALSYDFCRTEQGHQYVRWNPSWTWPWHFVAKLG